MPGEQAMTLLVQDVLVTLLAAGAFALLVQRVASMAVDQYTPDMGVLVPILSKDFSDSEKCLNHLESFYNGLNESAVGRSRVFKVSKTPLLAPEQPRRLRDLLGYDMYQLDPDSGEIREYTDYFSSEAERQYWMKMVDLAYDIYDTLNYLRNDAGSAEVKNIFIYGNHSPTMFPAFGHATIGGKPAESVGPVAAQSVVAPGDAVGKNAKHAANVQRGVPEQAYRRVPANRNRRRRIEFGVCAGIGTHQSAHVERRAVRNLHGHVSALRYTIDGCVCSRTISR